jgi:hypothetical protein
MHNYKVEQFTDDIVVWNSEKEFIKIKRKFDWKGKLTSSFIKDGICILETTYDIFLFRKFLSIKEQHLPVILFLSKEHGVFYLSYNGSRIKLVRHYLKNPIYTLYNNDYKIGEVNTELTGFTKTPIIWNVLFERQDDLNFYALLRFLMELPPTMDI